MAKTRMLISKPLVWAVAYVLLLAAIVSAQPNTATPNASDQYAAPIEWKLYKVSAADSAIKFPKFPVRRDESDVCHETQSSVYHAYADQTIYEFRFYAKANDPIPSWCLTKEQFGQSTFERRLMELRNSNPPPATESDGELNWRKAKVFKWATPHDIAIRWLVPDIGHDRWREIQINYRPDKAPDEKFFTSSLIFSSKDGIEIGAGSALTLGDKGFDVKPGNEESKESLLLQSKPRPPYTDLARESNTTGSVRLKVTFLANGGIGAITVDSGLPNGLTEQAISAAKKIVFLPARANRVPISVVKQVEYSFAIY